MKVQITNILSRKRRFVVMGLLVAMIITVAVLGWRLHIYRNEVRCKVNLKMIHYALVTYENDKGTLPAAAQWCDALVNSGYISETYFWCPAEDRHHKKSVPESDYVLNAAFASTPNEMPGSAIVVFEGQRGWNQVGSVEKAVFRHGNRCGVLRADGGIDMLSPEALEQELGRVD